MAGYHFKFLDSSVAASSLICFFIAVYFEKYEYVFIEKPYLFFNKGM